MKDVVANDSSRPSIIPSSYSGIAYLHQNDLSVMSTDAGGSQRLPHQAAELVRNTIGGISTSRSRLIQEGIMMLPGVDDDEELRICIAPFSDLCNIDYSETFEIVHYFTMHWYYSTVLWLCVILQTLECKFHRHWDCYHRKAESSSSVARQHSHQHHKGLTVKLSIVRTTTLCNRLE
jgi:hypothetical protein